MEPKVFLHYTQAELDSNYDQIAAVRNAADIIGMYSSRSAAVRHALGYSSYAYGPHPDEVLDLFPAGASKHPTLIFIHGGAWCLGTKDDYSFVAPEFVHAGISCIVLNCSKLPGVRLPAAMDQLRRAVVWLVENARDLGIDPSTLYLCGHSSGAHLAATLAVTDWSKMGLEIHPVRGVTLISGVYDLRPVLLSARRSYLQLSRQEEDELSPIRHLRAGLPSFLIVYGEFETNEYRRHSIELAGALQVLRRGDQLVCLDGINHFETAMVLVSDEHALPRMIVDHIRKATVTEESDA